MNIRMEEAKLSLSADVFIYVKAKRYKLVVEKLTKGNKLVVEELTE